MYSSIKQNTIFTEVKKETTQEYTRFVVMITLQRRVNLLPPIFVPFAILLKMNRHLLQVLQKRCLLGFLYLG